MVNVRKNTVLLATTCALLAGCAGLISAIDTSVPVTEKTVCAAIQLVDGEPAGTVCSEVGNDIVAATDMAATIAKIIVNLNVKRIGTPGVLIPGSILYKGFRITIDNNTRINGVIDALKKAGSK